jgi:hypothetical protein
MIKILIITLTILFNFEPTTAEEIETAQVITWDNLIPSTQLLEDPFTHLTDDQLYDLESIVYLLNIDPQQEPTNPENTREILNLTANLKSANLDVDQLLSTYTKYLAEIERRNGLVVDELNGQNIRLAGYVLPLEFSDKGVDEFLLVPYVGACIHVPPPPPNQIVYVRSKDKIMADDLYRPVWVTGRIVIEATYRDLTLVDGSDNIPIGYTIKSAVAEDYED